MGKVDMKEFLKRYLDEKKGDVINENGEVVGTHEGIHFFTIGQMIIVGSSYWNFGVGREKGDVANDEEGVKTMRVLGQNMAWLLKKINY